MFNIIKADNNNISKYKSALSAGLSAFDITLPSMGGSIPFDQCLGTWELPYVWHVMLDNGYKYNDKMIMMDKIDTGLAASNIAYRQMAVLVKLKAGQTYQLGNGPSPTEHYGPSDMQYILYDYAKSNASIFRSASGTGCIMNRDSDNGSTYEGVSFKERHSYTPDTTGLFIIGVAAHNSSSGCFITLCDPEPEVITAKEWKQYVLKES